MNSLFSLRVLRSLFIYLTGLSLLCLSLAFFTVMDRYSKSIHVSYQEIGDSHLENNMSNKMVITPTKSYLNGGPAPHNFHYVIANENHCLDADDSTVLIAVVSSLTNSERRQIIRETWGSKRWWIKKAQIKIVFLLGFTNDSNILKSIKKEQGDHGDIIQQDFMDSYRNLTLKSIMFLEWTSRHCRSAGYVLKVDDDVFLDVFQLIGLLKKSMKNGERCVICRRHPESEIMRQGIWAVNTAQLPGKNYPPYCCGPAVIYSRAIIEDLYQATFKVPFVPVEDVYLSGVLVKHAGRITFKNDLSFHTWMGQPYYGLDRYTGRDIPLASLPKRDICRRAWNHIFCNHAHLQKDLLEKKYHPYLLNTTLCLKNIQSL